MKKILYFFLLMLLVKSGLSAQQNHFIYIQSENRQPFTVSLNNKIYPSSATGYVIIPKLTSGEYSFTVKGDQQSFPESKFYVVVENKDIGFTFKPAKSLALTNIQNYVTLKAGERPLYASADAKKDAAKTTAKAPAVKLRKGVNKVSEVQVSNAVTLLYLDVHDNRTDTIDITIPTANTTNTTKAKVPANRSASANSKINFLPIETKSMESGLELVAVNQEGYNARCVNLASGDDFFKIRKKMASESSDDKMINEAKKAAKSKCYTTIQVKGLSALFMTDEGKFKFFREVYPLVYDVIQYPSLEKEFTDQSYAEKFRGLLHK